MSPSMAQYHIRNGGVPYAEHGGEFSITEASLRAKFTDMPDLLIGEFGPNAGFATAWTQAIL